MGELFLARAVYRFYLHPWKNKSVNDNRIKSSHLFGGKLVENTRSVEIKDFLNVLKMLLQNSNFLKLFMFLKDSISSLKEADNDDNSPDKTCVENTIQTFTERMHMFLGKAGNYLECTTVSLDTLRFFIYKTRVCRMIEGYRYEKVPLGRSYVFCKTFLSTLSFHSWILAESLQVIDSLVEFNSVTSTILQSLSYDVLVSVYQNVQYMHNFEMLFSTIENWSIDKLRPLVCGMDSSLLPVEIRHDLSISEMKRVYRAKASLLANLGPFVQIVLDQALVHLENILTYEDFILKQFFMLSRALDISSIEQVTQGFVPPLNSDDIRDFCVDMGITDSKRLDVAVQCVNAIWPYICRFISSY